MAKSCSMVLQYKRVGCSIKERQVIVIHGLALFVRFYNSRVGLSMAWSLFVRFFNTREVVVHSLIAILQVLQHKRGERCSIKER